MRSQPSSWVRKCQTLGRLPCAMTSASTLAPSTSGTPTLTASPSPTSRTSRAIFAPTSPSSFSTFRRSPSWTRYCLPPVRTTAYIDAPPCCLRASFCEDATPPVAREKDARSSQPARGVSRSATGLRDEPRESLLVRRTGDPALGDDRRDEPRGSDVECGVEHGGAFRRDAGPAEMCDLLRRPLFDRDVPAIPGPQVDCARRSGDEDRCRDGMRGEGERVRTDLFCGLPVAGDPVGTDDDAPDRA